MDYESKIIESSLLLLNVEKNYDGIEREYTWMDKKSYKVENYIGKSKKDCKSKYYTFVFKGTGDKVIDQLPKYGEMITEGSVVMIQLD